MKPTLLISIILFSIFTPSKTRSQSFIKKINSFIVEHYGHRLPHGFFGGTYASKSSFIDYDGDLDLDLFITQVDGRLTYYENDGEKLVFISDYFDSLNVGNWCRFVDIDGDGDKDIFAAGPSATMRLYENTGGIVHPVFIIKDAVVTDSSGNTIITENQSIPFFADIDADGDFDFFTGRSVGSLGFYENIGTAFNYIFRFVTDNFENILIISGAKAASVKRHGASGIVFSDIDKDLDLDIIWGDFFSVGMYYLENTGNKFTADFPDITSSTFPSPILNTPGFNVPAFADIDGDGDEDLFVDVLFRDREKDNFWFFKNNSLAKRKTAGTLQFDLITKNYIDGIDVGRSSHPVVADIDADGDDDIFIGSYQGEVVFYRNTTLAGHVITLSLDTTIRVPFPADEFISSPSFIDIDNDGDQDCFSGNFSGTIFYFRNIGNATNPVFELTDSFYQGIDVGNYSSPQFADIDHDGDFDLFVGEEDGTINYFKNVGTPSAPEFATPELDYLGIGSGKAESVPEIIDTDADGDLDFSVGFKDGSLSYYENIGSVENPLFLVNSGSYQTLKATQNAVSRFIDIDKDGDLDLLMGNIRGGIEFYEAGKQAPIISSIPNQTVFADSLFTMYVFASGNPSPLFSLTEGPANMSLNSNSGRIQWIPTSAQIGYHRVMVRAANTLGFDEKTFDIEVVPVVPERLSLEQNYPNPFNPETLIRFGIQAESEVTLKIYNILGQEVRTVIKREFSPGYHQVAWDGRDNFGKMLSSGIYLYRIKSGHYSKTKKMILLK
ncbi:VCBS repeat-containing protein [bacterium]|nr:VCBS repeat-containing protein [bacterium]